MPQSYFRGYERLDQSAGRREWLARNNYPDRRFGADFGPDGRGPGRRGYPGYGAHVDRDHWRSWCGPVRHHNWGGWCSNYFVPSCYPRWYSSAYCGPSWSLGFSTWYYGGYGWSNGGWGLWDYPGGYGTVVNNYETEYEIENYYAPQPAYATDYASTYAAPVTSMTPTETWAQSPVPPAAEPGLSQEAVAVPPELANYGQENPDALAADSYRTLAMQAFARGDFETARREFIRAVVAEPDDAELLMMYGYAHFATGDYLVASLSLRRAIEDDPSLLGGPVDILALYNNNASALETHIARLDEHMQANYDDADARFLAGFVRYASGRTAEAMGFFADCAARNPGDGMSLQLRDAAMQASQRSMAEPSAPAMPAAQTVEYLDMMPVTPS